MNDKDFTKFLFNKAHQLMLKDGKKNTSEKIRFVRENNELPRFELNLQLVDSHYFILNIEFYENHSKCLTKILLTKRTDKKSDHYSVMVGNKEQLDKANLFVQNFLEQVELQDILNLKTN